MVRTNKTMRIIANKFPTKCRETKKQIAYGDICLYDSVLRCVYHIESLLFTNYRIEHNIEL